MKYGNFQQLVALSLSQRSCGCCSMFLVWICQHYKNHIERGWLSGTSESYVQLTADVVGLPLMKPTPTHICTHTHTRTHARTHTPHTYPHTHTARQDRAEQFVVDSWRWVLAVCIRFSGWLEASVICSDDYHYWVELLLTNNKTRSGVQYWLWRM